MTTLEKMKQLDKDDLLHMVGLETRRTTWTNLAPGVAALAVGLLVGTGIGLMLAPRSGRDLREDIARRLQELPSPLGGRSANESPANGQATSERHPASDRTPGVDAG